MRIDYVSLGIAIYLAMMGHYASTRAIDYMLVQRAAKIASDELAKINEENRLRIENDRRLAAERQLERVRQSNLKKQQEAKISAEQKAIAEQRRETCTFWIKEYSKTRTTQDKKHRDQACRDAGMQGY